MFSRHNIGSVHKMAEYMGRKTCANIDLRQLKSKLIKLNSSRKIKEIEISINQSIHGY